VGNAVQLPDPVAEFTTTAPDAPTATQNELPGAHETAFRAPTAPVACCCQVVPVLGAVFT
jgi:hypothetical protein